MQKSEKKKSDLRNFAIINEVVKAIESDEITFNETAICERCENEYDATDPFLYTGDLKNTCRRCYCEIEFSKYADNEPCDADAVKELL